MSGEGENFVVASGALLSAIAAHRITRRLSKLSALFQ